MNRGKIEAKKPGKKLTTGQVVKTIGKNPGLLLAAGIALIAATDKTMSKAFPQEEKQEKVEAPDAPDAEQKEVK